MATKVHDQGDEQDFAEIDRILAQAKQERKLRRARNLSDIPENFAHVPSSTETRSTARNVSLDMSQPDLASRRDMSRPPRHPKTGTHHQPKLHVPGLKMAPIKWLRGYMGCLVAAQHREDHVQRSMQQQHVSYDV